MKRLLAILLLLTGCQASQDSVQMTAPVVPVHASTPTIATVPIYVETLGALKSSKVVDVRARVDGILTEVFVTEGQWVEKGSPLFQIDPRPYAINVHEAKAQIIKDEAHLQAAKSKLERFQGLADKRLISQNEWDELQSEARQARASVELDQARLDAARLELEYCQIVAPTAGRVGKLDNHPGQLLTKSQDATLAQIVTMDPLVVEFHVTEKEFAKFSNDTREIELYALSNPEVKAKASITFTDNHFDSASNQILLRAKLDNRGYSFRPGMWVKCKALVGQIPDALLVSQKAIKYTQSGPYLYVACDDGTASMRQLELGEQFEDAFVVLSGIEKSDCIITEGHERVFPGAKVEIKE